MEYNSFAAGLVTEVSEINNPVQIIREIKNYELQRDGSAYLRAPLQAEGNNMFTHSASASTQRRLRSFTWGSPDGSSSVDILLVQYGEDFKLYTRNKTSSALTNITPSAGDIGHLLGVGAAATSYGVQYGTSGGNIVSITDLHMATQGKWAVITGLEFVIGGVTYKDLVLVLEYDSSAGTVAAYYDWLWTRDFFGVKDTVPKDNTRTAATSMTAEHAYNLFNRGWYSKGTSTSSGTNNYLIRDFLYAVGSYPAVTDLYSLGVYRDSGGTKFTPSVIRDAPDVLGPAPQGHYIIPFTRRDLTTFNSVSLGRGEFADDRTACFAGLSPATFPTDTEAAAYTSTMPTDKSGRPNACAAYAGRFWYSFTTRLSTNTPDDGAPDIQTIIAFSQVLTTKKNAVNCYQKNDPTAADISDVLADDGGFIPLSGATNIKGMYPLGDSLVVIADNGVWRISPISGEAFSATSYTVERLSYTGCVHEMSAVVVDNMLMFWSNTGIEIVSRSEFGFQQQNLSDGVIKSWVLDNVKRFEEVVGVYDSVRNKVRWLVDYTSGVYTKELTFDVVLKAFSTNEFNIGTSRSLLGYIQLPRDATYRFSGSNVQISNYLYVVKNTNRVLSTAQLRYDDESGATYEWEDYDGPIDAEMKLAVMGITGGEQQETARIKRGVFMTTHMLRTEDSYTVSSGDVTMSHESGCTVDVFWDFADTSTSWLKGGAFQIYRFRRLPLLESSNGTYTFDYGQSVISTKNKIRGYGKTLQIRFRNDDNKDCKLLGFVLETVTNRSV